MPSMPLFGPEDGGRTVVISVRGRSRDELLADPRFVYCGRAVRYTRWTASPWGNPFGVYRTGPFIAKEALDWWHAQGRRLAVESGRDLTPIDLYDAWLDSRPELIARLPELIGKRLGCWCGEWSPGDPPIDCHAHRLAIRVNRLQEAA